MRDLKQAVAWDLDSTLADTRHRRHLSPAGGDSIQHDDPRLSWEAYAMACGGDKPLEGACTLVRLLQPHYLQIGVSGRSRCSQEETEAWLARHSVPLDRVWLRGPGNFTPNGTLKARRIKALQAQGLDVVLFVEDWPDAARQINEETGVPVLVLNPLYDELCTCGYADRVNRDAGS